jgi:hypothetical protein
MANLDAGSACAGMVDGLVSDDWLFTDCGRRRARGVRMASRR